MKFIMHMHVKNNQLILVRVLKAYQTFLQTTFSLLADTEPIKIQRRLIDLPKTEKPVRY